jgi:hypothetical protein
MILWWIGHCIERLDAHLGSRLLGHIRKLMAVVKNPTSAAAPLIS